MQTRSQQGFRFIPAMAVLSLLAAAVWLPPSPAANAERVLALFRKDGPEQSRIPDTLFLPQSESAFLPHYAPWGFP